MRIKTWTFRTTTWWSPLERISYFTISTLCNGGWGAGCNPLGYHKYQFVIICISVFLASRDAIEVMFLTDLLIVRTDLTNVTLANGLTHPPINTLPPSIHCPDFEICLKSLLQETWMIIWTQQNWFCCGCSLSTRVHTLRRIIQHIDWLGIDLDHCAHPCSIRPALVSITQDKMTLVLVKTHQALRDASTRHQRTSANDAAENKLWDAALRHQRGDQ